MMRQAKTIHVNLGVSINGETVTAIVEVVLPNGETQSYTVDEKSLILDVGHLQLVPFREGRREEKEREE
jgi:hypothetical protein